MALQVLITQPENKDYRWEQSKTTNLGLDVFLNNRVRLSVDAYIKKTTDLILNVPIQPMVLQYLLLMQVLWKTGV
jgi:hypothetical protein